VTRKPEQAAASQGDQLAAPPHQNHGLFSDHYLNQTLPLPGSGWGFYAEDEKVLQALGEIREIYNRFTPTQNEAQTEDRLIRPILKALGHIYELQPALQTPDTAGKPDYVFYKDESSRLANAGRKLTEEALADRALAVGEAKYWDRPRVVSKCAVGNLSKQNPAYQILV
jgi:hypothetical protein